MKLGAVSDELWHKFLIGIILAETVLILFMFLSKGSDAVGKLFFAGVAFLAVALLARFYMQISMMGDIYRVADKTVPDLLFDMGITVDTSRAPQIEPFKGLYLIEYSLNSLTVVWDVEKGVVGHRYKRIEDLKKDFEPRPREVLPERELKGLEEEDGGVRE